VEITGFWAVSLDGANGKHRPPLRLPTPTAPTLRCPVKRRARRVKPLDPKLHQEKTRNQQRIASYVGSGKTAPSDRRKDPAGRFWRRRSRGRGSAGVRRKGKGPAGKQKTHRFAYRWAPAV